MIEKTVLSGMKNTETIREPVSIEEVKQEITDVFIFQPPLSTPHSISCEKIQNACKSLAEAIVDEVPEGKERTIAMNNILSAALFARHGITRRQVVTVAVVQDPQILMEMGQSAQPT